MKDKLFNRILIGLAVVAVALVATDTRATEILSAPNAAGGQIYLTLQPCHAAALTPEARALSRYAYSTTGVGPAITGCFFFNTTTQNVHIYWVELREVAILPARSFGVPR